MKAIRLRGVIRCVRCMLRAVEYYVNDAYRYLKFSSAMGGAASKKQLESVIWATSHVIEKAFSLPSPRVGYGKDSVESLICLLSQYKEAGFSDLSLACQNALSVLREYRRFHELNGFDLSSLGKEIDSLLSNKVSDSAGSLTWDKNEYLENTTKGFDVFSASRFSVRHFSPNPVPLERIRAAVEIARKTPSVCNRQCWNVHLVRDAEMKKELCELQNGHRGFGDQVDSFLVVTSDLRTFFGLQERNQAFVDGGLFSMSLLYGLHFQGLGACPLNWCMPPSKDRALQQLLELHSAERVIMVIAIGNLPEKIKVAKSVRRETDDILSECK